MHQIKAEPSECLAIDADTNSMSVQTSETREALLPSVAETDLAPSEDWQPEQVIRPVENIRRT